MSNTFSVQFHTAPWFIAFARLFEICWYCKKTWVSLNPLGHRRQVLQNKTGKNLVWPKHTLGSCSFTFYLLLFASLPSVTQILWNADSWLQNLLENFTRADRKVKPVGRCISKPSGSMFGKYTWSTPLHVRISQQLPFCFLAALWGGNALWGRGERFPA